MTHILERTDARLAELVRGRLASQPSLTGTQIFVAVDGGALTLFGWVQRQGQAQQAETIGQAVDGIVAVAEELFIGPPAGMTDADIAKQAANALLRTAKVERVRATVRNRVMTLSGDVDWPYESNAACRAVKDIARTEILINEMIVRAPLILAELNSSIAAAVADSGTPEQASVAVHADSRGVLTISGTVGTQSDHSTVLQLCWALPGVTGVVDRAVVQAARQLTPEGGPERPDHDPTVPSPVLTKDESMTKTTLPIDHSGLEILPVDDCRYHLQTARVGRIAFLSDGYPTILPVNHRMDGDSVVFRTNVGSKLAAADNGFPVAFEVDGIDADRRAGWSVVVRGDAHTVDEPDEVDRLNLLGVWPWADAVPRGHWVRISGQEITGRKIVHTTDG